MQTAAANIISSGSVRCIRKLTRNGTVMVFPGQMTDPTMQIAWRKIWRTHFSINLYEALGLPKGSSLQDYLLINEGDFVSVSEPIARRSDRKTRTLNALYSGRYLGSCSGNLIFEADAEDLETVYAGFPGTVTEIIPDRGAVIETVGAFASGIWGNNRIGQGILLTLNDIAKDGVFTTESLSMAMSGSVVFANTCYDVDVLQATVRLSPGGLIFGSLPASLLPVAEQLPFPVIVTDSIGPGRISTPIYDILGENIIKCAYLYSAPARGNMPCAAEIIIPQEEMTKDKSGRLTDAAVGNRVRILDGYYAGEIGYIAELMPSENSEDGETEQIGDQIRVCIDEDTSITLPVNNVEILEDEKPRTNR
ncbi:MAG: hypothetical protein IKP86_09915 [Anaerolineaceae bacterium]|nr:hypothetical protein [Anaerolineaceae bacterium]